MSGNVQAVGRNPQVGAQGAFCSKLYEAAEAIAKIAIRVLFVVANLLMTAALFPISWHAIVIPFVAIGSVALAGFFFPHAGRALGERFPHPGPLIRPVRTDAPMPENFTEHAPVGYVRQGQNCAFNAAAHVLDSEPQIAEWLRNPIPEEIDLAGFQNFLNDYNPSPNFVQRFNEYVAEHPRQPIPALFTQFLQQYLERYAPQGEERGNYFSIQDAFRNMTALHRSLSEFYRANDEALQARQAVSMGNSLNLRVAVSRVSQEIRSDPHQQVDADELIKAILNMLPNRFKIHMQESCHMLDPQMPNPPLPRREPPAGLIPLDLNLNDLPFTLERLLQHHCNDERVEPVRRGEAYYQVERISREFVEPPSALRFHIRRFSQEWATTEMSWGEWLRSFFKTPEPRPRQLQFRKNDTPVECPEEFSIRLQNGEERRYRLASFLNHHGNSGGGHYTSAEIRDGRKYLEDDTVVTLVESQADHERWNDWLSHSYLLCYLPVQNPPIQALG